MELEIAIPVISVKMIDGHARLSAVASERCARRGFNEGDVAADAWIDIRDEGFPGKTSDKGGRHRHKLRQTPNQHAA